MKDKIIDLEDLKTFPSELVNLINVKRKLFLKYFRAVIESGDIEESFIDSFGEDETIILSQVNDILKGYNIIGYHISRICDDTISQKGVKKLSDDYYLDYMRSVFICKLGYSEQDTQKCIQLLENNLNLKNGQDRKCLSLFFPASRFLLYEKDGGYLDLYGDCVGGEIAKITFSNFKTVRRDLCGIGSAHIIKFIFPYDELTIDTEYPKNFVQKEILYFLSCLIFDDKLPYNALLLAQVDCDIQKENILEIIEINQQNI